MIQSFPFSNGCDGQELYYNDDPGAFDSDSESGTYETSECDIDGLFAMLYGITLPAGTYYVVVDGFDAETGNYGLFLEESDYTEIEYRTFYSRKSNSIHNGKIEWFRSISRRNK